AHNRQVRDVRAHTKTTLAGCGAVSQEWCSEGGQENYKQQTSDNYETEKPFTHELVSSHREGKIPKKDACLK
ncbi:MAG: hypothetical protein WAM77_32675, partial [Xanthobacteraceae bacterium]